jgi:hypothetical protein
MTKTVKAWRFGPVATKVKNAMNAGVDKEVDRRAWWELEREVGRQIDRLRRPIRWTYLSCWRVPSLEMERPSDGPVLVVGSLYHIDGIGPYTLGADE